MAKEFCRWRSPILAKMSVRQIKLFFGIVAALLLVFAPADRSDASAKSTTADVCFQAAEQAARETGVPQSVLIAISLTETGRRKDGVFAPWPWTVNMEGIGKWFVSREAALAYSLDNFDRGARSFDVGCFQLNYKWHGKAFQSIDQMFDPLVNARYAAQYLTELFAEKGNWEAAAGAYHSRTPKYAEKYQKRFSRIKAALNGSGDVGQKIQLVTKPEDLLQSNRFPLLQPGTATASGFASLFRVAEKSETGGLLKRETKRLF
jgi:hypothetical protein